MFDPAELLTNLPHLPGVYRMLNVARDVLYVGKARDLKKRVSSYFQKTQLSPRIVLMLSQVTDIETTVTRSEAEALILENNLIKGLFPKYNILFRDDKSYPFLVLTSHRYPRLAFHRGAQQAKNTYFGPFPNSLAVRDSIHLMQKIFRLRTCEDSVFNHRSRPCLLHQIRRCSGPCVNLISPELYQDDVRQASQFLQGHEQSLLEGLEQKMHAAAQEQQYESAALYRDQIQSLRKVQEKQFVESGDEAEVDVVALAQQNGLTCVNLTMIRGGRHLGDRCLFPQNAEGHLPETILEAFLTQHYSDKPIPPLVIINIDLDVEGLATILSEQARHAVKIVTNPIAARRVWLNMAEKNALLAIGQRLAQHATQEIRMAALIEALGLAENITRIECFDISHTMGEATVASCVVYDQNGMRNSEYRRFNISGIEPGDDYAAMRNALTRRYQKIASGEARRPDLVLIDGGKGQVGVAFEVLTELGLNDIELLGVAKGPERKAGMEELIFADGRKPIQLGVDHPGLHLIQQIRDEAHRFAITGHRARRGKSRTKSALDDIDGVGPKRRQMLLARFGGIKGVGNASVAELAKVEGISPALAERIYAILH